MIDWIQRAVERAHQVPEGWQWSFSSCIDAPEGFVRIGGAVPDGVYRSGPRKGRPKWPKEQQTLWITWDQVEEEKRLYEEADGLCARCEGTGKMNVGWSKEMGKLMERCERCGGTGQAPVG